MKKSGKKQNIYYSSTKEYKDKLDGRPYRLGLDLGVGSIGYAAVTLAESQGKTIPCDIIITGSRIFTASEGAADRRAKRGQRNALRHKVNRLTYLWKLLAEQKLMLPYQNSAVSQNTAICGLAQKRRKRTLIFCGQKG